MQNTFRRSPYNVSAVARAMDVLDLLSEQQTLRVRHVARSLSVAPSTAQRLLSTMQERGYVTQDPHTRVYRPGTKFFLLQSTSSLGEELRSASHPEMTQLRDSIGESVSLSVRLDGEVMFIDGVDSRQALRAAPRTGARLPAYATAGGKMQLSDVAPERLRTLYPTRLRALTSATITDREELEVKLQQVRGAGYCLSHQESTRGLSALAVPLRGEDSEMLAALAVVAPTQRLPDELVPELVYRLHSTARIIAQALT